MSTTIHSLKSKMNGANSNKRVEIIIVRQAKILTLFNYYEVGGLVMFVVSWEGP